MKSFLVLRQKQNSGWAEQSVRKGIEHANDRNYMLAMKCYQCALELDPENADAYVAIGAAQVRQSPTLFWKESFCEGATREEAPKGQKVRACSEGLSVTQAPRLQ